MKKSSAFSKLATRGALALMGWAASTPGKEEWSLPGPHEGEAFDDWTSRASDELAALSERAAAMGQGGGRAWMAAAGGLAKGAVAGYPLGLALGWCLAREKAMEGSPMDELSEGMWEVDLWDRSRQVEREAQLARDARSDPGLPLPSLFDGEAYRPESAWVGYGKSAAALALAVPLAPLGWGAGLAALPSLRSAGWRRLSAGLARAAAMMGRQDLPEGPPSAERAFEGWLDAARWMDRMDPQPGTKTLRALESYESGARAASLGLIRAPALGWTRMGRLGSEEDEPGEQAEQRLSREKDLAKESGISLAQWSLDRVALGEGARREVGSLAARWWAASGAEAACEERRLEHFARSVALAYLDPDTASAGRDATWALLGSSMGAQKVALAGADMGKAWEAVAQACGEIRRQSAKEGWPPALARAVCVELLAGGMEMEWAKLRALEDPEAGGAAAPRAWRIDWEWGGEQAREFVAGVALRGSEAAEAAGLGVAGLDGALVQAMANGYSAGSTLWEALEPEGSLGLLGEGFAAWEASSLAQVEAPAAPASRPRARL